MSALPPGGQIDTSHNHQAVEASNVIKKTLYGAVTVLVLAGCGSVDPELVIRPANMPPFEGDRAELVAMGATLWKDANLGKSGVSCESCHMNGAQFKSTFKEPYPHRVAMAKGMADLESIDAAQMVQFCMIVPMEAEPLPWSSQELAALSAYVEDVEQKQFQAK